MYVCFCTAVTESEIMDAVDNGARTIEDVSVSCAAGSGCGGCHAHIDELLEQRLSAPVAVSSSH